jgi:DNA-binding NarL/FixJ family response regulator
MNKQFEGLFTRLGLKREAESRCFPLDANLYTAVVFQAERKQMPAEELHAELVAAALIQLQTNEDLKDHWQMLSPREQDVTALTCLGYTNRQIARKLNLAPDTVKGYVRQVMIKFDLHGKSELRMRLGNWDFSKWGPEAQD